MFNICKLIEVNQKIVKKLYRLGKRIYCNLHVFMELFVFVFFGILLLLGWATFLVIKSVNMTTLYNKKKSKFNTWAVALPNNSIISNPPISLQTLRSSTAHQLLLFLLTTRKSSLRIGECLCWRHTGNIAANTSTCSVWHDDIGDRFQRGKRASDGGSYQGYQCTSASCEWASVSHKVRIM